MKKILALVILNIILVAALGACSFKDVEVVEISFYDGSELLDTISLYKYNQEGFADPTKNGYTFKGWYLDKECTKEAILSEIKSNCSVYAGWEKNAEIKYYTVTFMNDNTVWRTIRVASGSSIDEPESPQKAGYVFSQWIGKTERVFSDLTLYAEFKKICRVDFYLNENDSDPYASKTVVEGNKVELPAEPVKSDTVSSYFTFKGWTGDLNDIRGDMKVYAKFEEHKIGFTYSFINEDGSVITKGNGYYGDPYTIPEAEKEADQNNVYVLEGYKLKTKNGVEIKSDNAIDAFSGILEFSFTAVAVFSNKPRAYTVRFYKEETLETLVDEISVDYGEAAHSEVIPTKEEDVEYTYEFSSWNQDLSSVTNDMDVYAVFDKTKRQYTYRFIDHNGNVIKEETDYYGSIVVAPEDDAKPSDTQYSYKFIGWSNFNSEGDTTVSGNVDYVALFEEVTMKYTYVFYFLTEIYASGELEYKQPIPLPEDPQLEGYTFDGWTGYPKNGVVLITSNCEFYTKFVEIK